ncbi:MAG: formylglycine-generating enzyme family protein [Crocinitomicaceae bacterium]|nr:formylglycine-generating enzyme family protein [Crocinitomicaceae bacterium]
MKSILLIINVCITGILFGQEPQTVHSIVKERQEAEWYVTQASLWKKEIEANPKNANAWYNYYSANRQLRNVSFGNKEKEMEYSKNCNQIVKDAYQEVPESFEANHMKWWNEGFETGEIKFLMKAHEINPNDSRAFGDLIIHYETSRQIEKMKDISTKMFEANELPNAILNWGYNALSELEQGAVVFTGGDNDTYAMWIVQNAKNFRTDVRIVNTYLIALDDYRKKITEELGMPEISYKPEEGGKEKMLKAFLNNEQGIPIHIAISAIREFEKADVMDDLYLTGLTYQYSKESIDNISLIQRNYEKRYLIDYLKERFSTSISDAVADRFEPLYLPSMLKLYKHYAKSEETTKMNSLEKLIISISEKSGQQSEVYDVLENCTGQTIDRTFSTMLLDIRSIEKELVELSSNIFISKYEVTNENYTRFINNVLRSREVDLYNQIVYDSSQWSNLNDIGDNDPMVNMYHWHPAYVDYPVVNISHEAAKAYCAWLTQQYNKQRKRNYEEVLFRLPTEEEWMKAASSNQSDVVYGLQGDKLQNEKGCYLSNLNPEKENQLADGGFYTVKVESYCANDLGLFNTIGNVAEMIDMPGVAKGGSWYNDPKEAKIKSQLRYKGPDPGIGFRVVMEVVKK